MTTIPDDNSQYHASTWRHHTAADRDEDEQLAAIERYLWLRDFRDPEEDLEPPPGLRILGGDEEAEIVWSTVDRYPPATDLPDTWTVTVWSADPDTEGETS